MKLCSECNVHYEEDIGRCPTDDVELQDVGNDPLIGQLIGDKYRILCQAGEGSMSVVYKALQESTGRDMAVKMLHKFLGDKEDLVRRFFREAKAVSSLHHTNIIKLYDFGLMPDEQPYIVTEYLDGINLSQLLRAREKLTVNEALPLIEQICNGVAEAHRNRVIHRDLKPDNIVLQGVDVKKPKNAKDLIGMNCVRVVDFGVAKLWGSGAASASLTVEGKVCGSPAYMSPEQCKGGDIDFRTDIYSIGVVLFEIFTGKRPFVANDLMALMLMHVNKEPPTLSEIAPEETFPPGLSSIVARCLSKDPDERFKSVEALWWEIESVCRFRRGRPKPGEGAAKEDDWIPFEASGSNLILPTGSTGRDSSAMTRTDTSGHALVYDWTRTTNEMPQLRPPPKGGLRLHWGQLKGVVFLAVLVVSVFSIVDIFKKTTDVNTARSLMNSGNLEGCIQILETVDRKSLSPEDTKMHDRACLELAKRRMSEGKIAQAASLLDRIGKDSEFFKQAQEIKANLK